MRVDGTKLFRMIKNNEIEDGTKIYMEPSISTDHRYYTVVKKHGEFDVWRENLYGEIKAEAIRILTVVDLNKYDFVIPEDNKIDIQAITCFDEIRDVSTWSNDTLSHNQRSIISKVNKIIKAIKQLDNKIK